MDPWAVQDHRVLSGTLRRGWPRWIRAWRTNIQQETNKSCAHVPEPSFIADSLHTKLYKYQTIARETWTVLQTQGIIV